jgi:hypothetical protein
MVPVLSVTGCTALPAPGDIGGMPPFTGVAIDGWGELFRDGSSADSLRALFED